LTNAVLTPPSSRCFEPNQWTHVVHGIVCICVYMELFTLSTEVQCSPKATPTQRQSADI